MYIPTLCIRIVTNKLENRDSRSAYVYNLFTTKIKNYSLYVM